MAVPQCPESEIPLATSQVAVPALGPLHSSFLRGVHHFLGNAAGRISRRSCGVTRRAIPGEFGALAGEIAGKLGDGGYGFRDRRAASSLACADDLNANLEDSERLL